MQNRLDWSHIPHYTRLKTTEGLVNKCRFRSFNAAVFYVAIWMFSTNLLHFGDLSANIQLLLKKIMIKTFSARSLIFGQTSLLYYAHKKHRSSHKSRNILYSLVKKHALHFSTSLDQKWLLGKCHFGPIKKTFIKTIQLTAF